MVMGKIHTEMSGIAQSVVEELDWHLDDCKDEAQVGLLVGEARESVIRTAEKILDNWPEKLTGSVHKEVLDWFQAEYGICL